MSDRFEYTTGSLQDRHSRVASTVSLDQDYIDDLGVRHSHKYYTDYARKRTINQYEDRCPGTKSSVICQAIIFEASSDSCSNRDTQVVTYQDDRPLQFATGGQKKTTQNGITQPEEWAVKYDNENSASEPEEGPVVEWIGPVLQVNFIGRAKFSYRVIRDGRKQEIIPYIPEMTEDLPLEIYSKASIVIKSPHLLHALEELIDYYPSFHTQLKDGYKKDFKIDPPFAVVMHHFQSLKELVEKEHEFSHQKDSRNFRRAELQQNHMRYLYEFAEPLYRADVVPCEQHLSEVCPRIAFDMIWYLFKPGTDVYVQ